MNDERLSIMRMLSEGKITSEEAERLLAALETDDKAEKTEAPKPESRPEVPPSEARAPKAEVPPSDVRSPKAPPIPPIPDVGKIVSEAMKNIPDVGKIVSDAMSHAFRSAPRSPQAYEGRAVKDRLEELKRKEEEMRQRAEETKVPKAIDFTKDGKLRVSVGGGDLTIIGTDGSTLVVEGDLDEHTTHVGRTEDAVTISAVGDITLRVPRTFGSLHAHVGGGDLVMEDVTVTEDMALSLGGGDATIKRCGGGLIEAPVGGGDFYAEDLTIDEGLSVRASGGDISVILASPLTKGVVVLHAEGGGNVALGLPEESSLDVSMHARGGGKVFTDLPFEVVRDKSKRSFEGTLHGGGAKVTLLAQDGGDVSLRRK